MNSFHNHTKDREYQTSQQWAVLPKYSPEERKAKAFDKHNKQLANARMSGIGAREIARRVSQLARGFIHA